MNYGLRDAVKRLVSEREGKKGREEDVKVIELARSHVAAGMKRKEVLDRLGENWRYEEASVHIKRKGSGSWRRGHCRRYGMNLFIFIPKDKVEEETLEIKDYDLKNDVEWALGAAEKRLTRVAGEDGK